jgi:diacylglycerol kinase family enzyme
MHLPIVKATLGSSFNIQCAKEMPIQVDGELIYAKHIQVQVLENKFSFRY